MAPSKGNGKGIQWIRAHLNYEGDDCLQWPMYRDDKGYGVLGYMGKMYRASRLMCIEAHGEPPTPDYEAAHSCANGHLGCIHPKHLSWKTRSENTQDAIEHGRYGHGVGWKGKLPKQSVLKIREMAGRLTNTQLGKLFDVHPETIAKIRRGETWRNIR